LAEVLDRGRHTPVALLQYGANYEAGGAQHLFWEIESHFPGQVEPKKP
jgi:hypothetical protein